MNNTGLVLEGGGMKGLYTAGVLEYFMEQNMFFPYVIGVSAGACMGASYLSRQHGRNKKVNTGLVNDPRYLSYRNLLFKRQLFGMDFLFDEIPNKIVPFDFKTFHEGAERFVIGATDCNTGEAVYFEKHDHGDDILTLIRASSSLPFIAPPVPYEERMLLDGGIVDPIPLKKAEEDGFKRNIVIMTKTRDFKRKRSRLAPSLKYLYRSYPKVAERLQTRHEQYNHTLDYLFEQQQKKNVWVIQPSLELPVSRIERNRQRLIELYELGYNDAKTQLPSIEEWLNDKKNR